MTRRRKPIRIVVASKGRFAHVDLGTGLAACMREIRDTWRPLENGEPFPGLCWHCASRLRDLLGNVATPHAAGLVVTLRGLTEPVCPKCGCSRPDTARRRDGDCVNMTCPACGNRWRMVVDFLWDFVVEPGEDKG